MADPKSTFNPADDLKKLVLLFAAMWVFWVFTGGPRRYEEAQKPFLQPPVTRVNEQNIWVDPDIRQQYGSVPSVQIQGGRGSVTLGGQPLIQGDQDNQGGIVPGEQSTGQTDGSGTGGKTGGKQSSGEYGLFEKPVMYLTKGPADTKGRSYIKIDLPGFNQSTLNITGFTIKDIFGKSVVLGGASILPYQGRVNDEFDIIVLPGSVIYMIEGISPIGVSFRVNKCIGLLAQFQSFYPPLPSLPSDILKNYAGQLPLGFTYNNCVDTHMSDSDFFSNDWRIYLGAGEKVWGETGDLIKIIDSSGNTLTSFFY